MTAIAARGRGLATTVAPPAALAELDAARTADELTRALVRAGVAIDRCEPEAIDQLARDRVARDLATLARWSRALDALALDEDRRSIRAIARGIVASSSTERRLAAATATPRLPANRLAELARATTLAELADRLADHPLAAAVAAHAPPGELLELETALARRFAELARSRDRALRSYLAQLIDAENAGAALALAARGGDLDPDAAFVPGGNRLDRTVFAAAVRAPIARARDALAQAFADTALERALHDAEPAALEDATLTWQLATQARLRRTEPLGLAPALYAVLRRRDEARHLRRAAWRVRLAGAA